MLSTKCFVKSLTIFVNSKATFDKILPKRGMSWITFSPNFTMLDSWVFAIFIWTDELLAKAIQSLETYVLVDNNLCGKLVRFTNQFNERVKVTSVKFFLQILTY